MKTSGWIVLTVLMAAMQSAHGLVLIDSTTGNGGFESGTTNLYSGTDAWSNLDTDKGDVVECRIDTNENANAANSGAWGGRLSRDGVGYRQPTQNTGYLVQPGDVFRVNFSAAGAWNFDPSTDKIRANLFVYDDDGITMIGVGNYDFSVATNWSYSALDHTYGSGVQTNSAAIGRELHIRFLILAPVGGQAFIDDVKLSVFKFETDIIAPDLRNGGFESGTTDLYSGTDDWTNYDTGYGDTFARVSTNDAANRASSGEWGGRLSRDSSGYRQPTQNTGYIIREGDSFTMGAYVSGAWNFDPGADQIRFNLFALADDGVTRIAVGNYDAPVEANWSYRYVAHETDAVQSGDPAIGRELHIRILPLCSTGEQAFVDDIQLSVFSVFNGDLDGDGIPNWWEEQYFGSSTGAVATADGDIDTYDNLSEYIALTDPTNKASFFSVGELQPQSGTGPVIVWDAVEGRSYEILWSSDLAYTPFSALYTNAYPVNSYTDTVHAVEGDGYYRMNVWLSN